MPFINIDTTVKAKNEDWWNDWKGERGETPDNLNQNNNNNNVHQNFGREHSSLELTLIL
jgi:hypothetical protein